MPKISSTNTKGLFIRYLGKIALSSLILIIGLCVMFSFIILKLDIDVNICKYIGILICIVSSFAISYVSITGFKNNFLPLAIISVLPLIIMVIINFFINDSDVIILIVKVIAVIVMSVLASIIKSKRRIR